MSNTQTTEPLTLTDNPMWNELAQHVRPGTYTWGPKLGIEYDRSVDRFNYCSKYAWTVTSPDTVAFVAEHLGDAVDPLAGSGYWAYLLGQLGLNVAAYDKNPPGVDSPNRYHRGTSWLPINEMDAVAAVARSAPNRNLLLSWPPYDEPIGAQVLKRFEGSRVVYIGEVAGGCCGDDEMFELLERDWNFMGEHEPVQWFGMHDYVQVFDRKAGAR